MQWLNNRPLPTAEQEDRTQWRLGIAGAVAVTLILAVTAALYVLPLGKSSYSAEFAEAQSVKVGDDVRLAGVPVGKVTSVELQADRVRMSFTVDSAVFVGDATTLDIRMLTIVGGNYVALAPAGSHPLGDAVIPAERVRLPYSLIRIFQDAAAPIREVDGTVLRENFTALQQSLTGSPEGLRSAGNAIDSLVNILDRQNRDVSQALDVADEYVDSINGAKSVIKQLIDKISLLETVLIDKQAEVLEALRLTLSLLSRLAALEPTWQTTLRPLAEKLAASLPDLHALGDRLGSMVTTVQDLLGKTETMLPAEGGITIDQSTTTITAPAICVPVPGRSC